MAMEDETMGDTVGDWGWDEVVKRHDRDAPRHAWAAANTALVDALMSGEMVAVHCGVLRGWMNDAEDLEGGMGIAYEIGRHLRAATTARREEG